MINSTPPILNIHTKKKIIENFVRFKTRIKWLKNREVKEIWRGSPGEFQTASRNRWYIPPLIGKQSSKKAPSLRIQPYHYQPNRRPVSIYPTRLPHQDLSKLILSGRRIIDGEAHLWNLPWLGEIKGFACDVWQFIRGRIFVNEERVFLKCLLLFKFKFGLVRDW